VRQASAEEGRPVAVMQDLQGVKIRTGKLCGGEPVELRAGRRFTLTTQETVGDVNRVSTPYRRLPAEVSPGDRLLLSDGQIELRAESVSGTEVVCLVVMGGMLRENQGINLPSGGDGAPSLTEKDVVDLKLGVELGVDCVAVSFVRRAEDVLAVREHLARAGSDAAVIAKIEKPSAVERLSEIVQAADGIIVARGDLGVELSLEQVPAVQKRSVRESLAWNRISVIATQMLDSMMRQPFPTRAEVSDVANAVLDGADALLLSGETAVGKFPVQAVETMARIIEEAESMTPLSVPEFRARQLDPVASSVCESACRTADAVGAKAVVVFTTSGYTAKLVSAFRPRVPVLAFTPLPATASRMALYWGVGPLLMQDAEGLDSVLAELERILLEQRRVAAGDRVVVVGGAPLQRRGITNLLKVHEVEAR
jgi:pyruvate kinase